MNELFFEWICSITVVACVLVSLLGATKLKQCMKDALPRGSAEWDGGQAVRLYLKQNGVQWNVREERGMVNDHYEPKFCTFYLSELSAKTRSVITIQNTLRTAASAQTASKNSGVFLARQCLMFFAKLMALVSPPLVIVSLFQHWHPALLAGTIMAALVYVIHLCLYPGEKAISQKIIHFCDDNEIFIGENKLAFHSLANCVSRCGFLTSWEGFSLLGKILFRRGAAVLPVRQNSKENQAA